MSVSEKTTIIFLLILSHFRVFFFPDLSSDFKHDECHQKAGFSDLFMIPNVRLWILIGLALFILSNCISSRLYFFIVPCCDLWLDFRVKRCSVFLYFHLNCMIYLICHLYLFTYTRVLHDINIKWYSCHLKWTVYSFGVSVIFCGPFLSFRIFAL